MKIFVDVSPAFYKTLFFNELSKKEEIYVIYNGSVKRPFRGGDFLEGQKLFKHRWLKGGKLSVYFQLLRELYRYDYQELIVGGYNTIYPWLAVCFSPSRKNSCIIESTYRETKKDGIRAWAKRLFFMRVSKAYVCGKSHADLVKAFGFNGKIIEIGTVGLIRRVPQPVFVRRKQVKKFLYVGRLTAVKNLEWLISRFVAHPGLELSIIGSGELENKLKKLAAPNILFLGMIDNADLPKYYRESDVFILPSYYETYGIVVEEALNNGTPVLVSNMVGCQDNLVARNSVGLVFDVKDDSDFDKKLNQICDIDYYNELRLNVSKLDFEAHAMNMVNSFVGE